MKPSLTNPQRYGHVRVEPRSPKLDAHGCEVLAEVRHLGLQHVEGVHSSRVYLFEGALSEIDLRLIAEELLADPVAEQFALGRGLADRPVGGATIEVQPLPGVMNPAAASVREAARRLLCSMGRSGVVEQVQTARRYEIRGARGLDDLERIASKVLANDCIETWYIRGIGRADAIPDRFPEPPTYTFQRRHVPLRSLGDDDLRRLSRDGHLFLSLDEMRAIQTHYAKLGRDPTDLELETLAQTWSEHCVHKTLRGAIDYRGDGFGTEGTIEVRFENLLKETIAAATHALQRDWCLSVFVDNAGVIALDDEYGVAFKVETHNHPSAIEPYGGSATGIGGCIRDVMGCGLGAKPIASTDVFCLAPPSFAPDRVPQGVLHPRRVLKGVVRGVRDYGNRMGIPTVNGAIYFDDRYLANPLVFCGCVGLIPRRHLHKQPNAGDGIVVAGGRTGRDGIHGATFSSAELTDQHADEFSHAVQIGNAIEEKKLLDAQLIARDHPSGCLYSAVTDCGAGGLSSAVGEMGADLGATVDLEKVPLKYAGLRYDEIWISEAQERMVFAVPPHRLEKFLAVFAAEDVEATVIGRFGNDGALHVRYDGATVGELSMEFLHHGIPRTRRTATWSGLTTSPPPQAPDARSVPRPPALYAQRQGSGSGLEYVPDASAIAGEATSRVRTSSSDNAGRPRPHDRIDRARLLSELRNLNVASKEWVIRQYDHEVQGRSVVKPLVGRGAGPSDAAVIRPRYETPTGIALGCGLCPEWSDIDPYLMAVLAVDEALRNVVCVGADPNRTAILDNFCWPKADSEESLGALVRACKGASDAAVAYGLPFISGKDSLNNEFSMSASEAQRTGLPPRLAIPPTLLISAIGIVHDVRRCVSMDLKKSGNFLALASAPVVGGAALRHAVGFTAGKALHDRVAGLIQSGRVAAAHDVSDGGILIAVAEMCIASGWGASVKVDEGALGCGPWDAIATTYVLEMSESDATASGLPIIGRVLDAALLRVQWGGAEAFDVSVEELARAWREPLMDGGH
ncbi:MAG: AIR synthase-related protein [Planctomycetota bacterium]